MCQVHEDKESFMKKINFMKKIARRLILTMTSTLIICGCSTTHQADSVKPSGFLANYSQLKKGGDEEALLRYVNPRAQWDNYTKILLQPVKLYASKGSDLRNASAEERAALANYFTAVLREELAKDFQLVSSPGPGVMTIRAAITDADESEVVLDLFTTVMPVGLALSALKSVATGSGSFVGEAQAEIEILDSSTSTRLAAAVDRRVGTKALRSKFGAWNDAKEACDYWAGHLRERLKEMRDGRNG
jgi:hypothetical protein